jgi:hypothetical protein
MRVAILAVAAAVAAGPARAEIPLALDHAWIAVRPNAPERAAFERAGFRIAPTVNRHDGQGSASVTVEFENGFLELLWPDDTVPVAPEAAPAKQRFVNKMNWRADGWSPFAVGLHWTAPPQTLPFDTWKVSAAWMGPGKSMEMLTPRGSPATTLFIPVNGADLAGNRAAIAKGGAAAAPFMHPNGARRLTSVRIVAPTPEGLPPAAPALAGVQGLTLDVGQAWLMEVTLDGGAQHRTADLRPDLPMVIRY